MRLLIVRHAEAEPGAPDEERALTALGRRQARELGERLRKDGLSPDVVLTSPLLRARETASALALGEPTIDGRIAPGATPEQFRDAARGRGETVLLVGHQPDCGRAAAALSGEPAPAFPPCGLAILELQETSS